MFSMGDGVTVLLGAVVGGVLVIVGDLIARRLERKARWENQVREAAAAVIASYGSDSPD